MQSNDLVDNLDQLNTSDPIDNLVSSKYKDKKLENRLKKYEAIIKKVDNINRVDGDSQVSFRNY